MSRYYYNLIASMVKADPTNPLWDGLLAYYTADNTPNDALGTYNGTLVNGATYGTGIISNGFSFDGVNDYIQLPNGTFNPSGDFSISMWLAQDVQGNYYLFNVGGFTTNGISIYALTSGIRFTMADNSTFQVLSNNSALTNGVLAHFVFIKDTNTNTYKIYKNGTLISNQTITVDQVIIDDSCRIGYGNSGTWPFNGIIDEVGLWDRALSSTEVTELYNSGSAKQYPN